MPDSEVSGGAPPLNFNLKEQIAGDIFSVFLNEDEFADWHTVNGSRLKCIIDKNNVHMRASAGRRTEGVREDSFFLYIHAGEFRTSPEPNSEIDIDGKKYAIRSVSDEMGLLVIEYGRVFGRNGNHISGNAPGQIRRG